ncbi:hypothetical protein ACWA7J_05025 [Leptothrix sp. BB-4]
MSWFRTLALCGIASVALPLAQAASPAPARPDPLDPDAAVAPLPHRSVWPQRATAEDATPVDWRAAHEAVRRAGGWRAYAREVQR